MAARKQQSHAKRAREFAQKEKRELKRAKKAERAAGGSDTGDADAVDPAGTEENAEAEASEWVA